MTLNHQFLFIHTCSFCRCNSVHLYTAIPSLYSCKHQYRLFGLVTKSC